MYSLRTFAISSLASTAMAHLARRASPQAVSSELAVIIPAGVTNAAGASVFFSEHPAAAATFASEFSSIVVNNPSYFPASLDSALGASSPMETGAAMGGSGSGSAGEQSIISEISAIAPTVTNTGVYFSQHPAAFTTYFDELSSIIVANPTYFPSLASELTAGGGDALPTAADTSAAVFGASTKAGSGNTGVANDPFAGIATAATSAAATANAANTANTAAAASSAAGSSSGNYAQAMQTPALGLGLTGAAVAGIAGLAAFL